jgi:hypothetical protein
VPWALTIERDTNSQAPVHALALSPPLSGRRALVVATYFRLPKLVVQYCCSLREGESPPPAGAGVGGS